MDFRETVIGALDSLIASGKVETFIEEALANTVKETVSHQLRTYSDFGKQLETKIKEAFALHADLQLPSYNDVILKIVRAQVEGHTNAVIQKQVAANLEELLKPAPAEITLSTLVEQYIEYLKESERGGCVCHGYEEITLRVEENDYGSRDVNLHPKPNANRHECDIQIGATKEGKIYWLRFRDGDVEKRLFAGPFYGFERSLFQMKAAGTILKFDVDPSDIQTSYALAED